MLKVNIFPIKGHFMKKLILLALLATALFTFNCSISDSLNTISNSLSKSSDSIASLSGSIKSISGSISGSSSGGGDKKGQLYILDVKDLTYLYFSTNHHDGSFLNDLSDLAIKHNITNWEKTKETYIGIGKGLKKANLSSANLEIITKDISSSSPQASKFIQEGFDSI